MYSWMSASWWHIFMWGDYLVIVWVCGRCHHGHHLALQLYPDREMVIAWP
jgi:hypothetical protein